MLLKIKATLKIKREVALTCALRGQERYEKVEYPLSESRDPTNLHWNKLTQLSPIHSHQSIIFLLRLGLKWRGMRAVKGIRTTTIISNYPLQLLRRGAIH